MNEIFEKAYSIDDFQKKGHELIDMLAEYLANATTNRDDDRVINYRDPEEQLAYWTADFEQPVMSDPLELFRSVLSRSVQIHRKKYLGHQTTPTLPLSVLSATVSTLLNQGMGIYEMGMVGNALEKILTEFVAGKLGFAPGASGFITSGGSLGNLTALLAARAATTDIWNNGFEENQKLAILVSEESHYCIDRSVRIMGLGAEGIIKVPVNEKFQMRTDLLEQHYLEAVSRGMTVLCVVGCAATTSTGSYDDLDSIAAFCRKYDLWFHVDGAHGAPAAFSEKYRHLIKGIEKADSVIVDFHKMMMTPSLSTAVIFKRGKDAYNTFSQRAHYLWSEQSSEEWYNTGKRSFECTKAMTSLNVYTLFRAYGEEIFRENIEKLFGLAEDFASLLGETPDFQLAYAPQCNIVCFRYKEDEQLNKAIRQKLLEDGRFYIVQTILNGQFYLRVSLMNPLTTIRELNELVEEIRQIASTMTASASLQ